MSRAERLLELMQALRRRRFPASGASLASELGISIRTLYRDIASLRSQGAEIAGEPGIGFILKPGYLLPPLMFSHDEIEALALGSRWVAGRTDAELAQAAHNLMAKVAAVLPADLRRNLETSPLLVGTGAPAAGDRELARIRKAIRGERKLIIRYSDAARKDSLRTIWPFAIGFFDHARVVSAWCELRDGIRHFRTDRIAELTVLDTRYPRRRQSLLKEWRRCEGIPEQ